MNDVTLLIKTFKRPQCVESLIRSIRVLYPDVRIIVVDDSGLNTDFSTDELITTYNIAYDSGLAAGRNFGVTQTKTKYVVLLDDDFQFTSNTNLQLFVEIFEESSLDVLGGAVVESNGTVNDYYGRFYYVDDGLVCKRAKDDYARYSVCDIIPNFFIAKTDKLLECQWDNELKLGEHTAFFHTHLGKLRVGMTPLVAIFHQRVKTSSDYGLARQRGLFFFNYWMVKSFTQTLTGKLG